MYHKENVKRGILVSPEDEYLLHKYLFWVDAYTGYCSTMIGGKSIRLHRLIMPEATIVDHANRVGQDNRRENLRSVSHTQSMQNRGKNTINQSGYKGVTKDKKRWAARIVVNKLKLYIGSYETSEQAAKAYDEAALKYFGKYSVTNFKESNNVTTAN